MGSHKRKQPIGIDLGTTNSLVAYVEGGGAPKTITREGSALVPSVVAYLPEGEVVVGHGAKDVACEEPESTIASAKRFMGRAADDPATRDLGPYVFDAPRAGEANTVRFVVAGGRRVTPVEVSAEILRALKATAEETLGDVGGAVITVPAYFDDAQRQATKDAARLAGIDVLRLLNEPTAAALAYGVEKDARGTFAVYDLGGGTFDVTILLLEDGVFQVRSTGGHSQLGGDDMDAAIAAELLKTLGLGTFGASASPGHSGVAASSALVRSVLDAARDVKHQLTTSDVAYAEIPDLEGGPVAIPFSRARFEELLRPLLDRTGVACRRALKDAGLEASDIDRVILVGGATRVPAVRRYVASLFAQQPLCDIDPDRVVALGAAVQADLLAGADQTRDLVLLDVLPLSIGVEIGAGGVDRLLPRNATIPTTAHATYTTQEDNQTGFEIHVVQGERELAADCRSLARFVLRGIPPMPAGMARLEITFQVDADALLSVHAKELNTGIEQTVQVKPTFGLDEEAIQKMLADAQANADRDLARRRHIENLVEARRVLLATRKAVNDDGDLLEAGQRARIDAACDALEKTMKGDDGSKIRARLAALDYATKALAGARMNRAIAGAMQGQRVESVEETVAHAKGIENAHPEQRRTGTDG